MARSEYLTKCYQLGASSSEKSVRHPIGFDHGDRGGLERLRQSIHGEADHACPGYVTTDLNDHQGYRSVEERAREAVRLATLPADGPTGKFFDESGPVPW